MPPFQFVLRGDALLPSRSEVARGAAQIASTLAVGFTLMPKDAMFQLCTQTLTVKVLRNSHGS